jgi:hypothetical protein
MNFTHSFQGVLMTYTFNAEDNSATDYPNPYRIENWFLLLSALMLVAGGVSALLSARSYLQATQDGLATLAGFLALACFALGFRFALRAMSQLRFMIGRNSPRGLASEVPLGQSGIGLGSNALMQALRQQAICFPEQQTWLSGLLMSLIPSLASSPPPLQTAAIRHAQTLVEMLAILLSMGMSLVLFDGSPYEGMVSWLYLPLAGLSLLTPVAMLFSEEELTDESTDGQQQAWKLLALVAFAILAPAALPRVMPVIDLPVLWLTPLLLLLAAMVTSVLFLASLFAQPDNVTQTSVSCEQATFSLQGPPAQLWLQMQRDCQANWVNEIPNRVYAWLPPVTAAGERGSFAGRLLEETQPALSGVMTDGVGGSWRGVWQNKYARYLSALSIWGMVLAGLMAMMAAHAAQQLASMDKWEICRALLLLVAVGLASAHSFQIGHLLWSRLYFKSRLIWLETEGHFQSAKVQVGNQFKSHLQSSTQVTRVEDASLRLWVADIVTVAFGKDEQRYVMAMAPADGFARSSIERLLDFAQQQSVVTAPNSARDMQQLQHMGKLDRAMRAAATTASTPECIK